MPAKRRSYNRYGRRESLLEAAWRAHGEHKMTPEDVLFIQDSIVPDCSVCGAAKAMMTIEKRRLCMACWRAEIRKRMGGRDGE
jgi:hypothetical protein